VSLLFFGRGVVGSPSQTVVGDGGSDKSIFMWALEWWPTALTEGKDPFLADVVWAPDGMDLSWVAAIPGPSLLAAPLTETFGPVPAYNVLALLAPATAAWSCFLLARWVTGLHGAALVAGMLFGFSSYELGQTIGHLHLTLVFPIPLCILFVLRRATGDLTRRRFLLYLTAALTLLFVTSTELFLMLVGVGVVSLALAWWLLGTDARPSLKRTAAESVGALLLTSLAVAPYLVHALVLSGVSYAPTRDPFGAAADLANYIVPRRWTWIHPPWSNEIARHFSSNPVESTAYLGLPLVAIILHFATRREKPRSHHLLLAVLAVAAFASLGAWIRVVGVTIGIGPWQVLSRLPVTSSALPVRITLFVALFAALVCALWLAERRGSRIRWIVAVAAIVALLPTPSASSWSADVPRPRFFADGHAQRALNPDDIVLVLPYGKAGWSMLWQAETGFAYRMAGGRLGNFPPDEGRWQPVLRTLAGEDIEPHSERLAAFLVAHGVDAIVVVPGTRRGARAVVEGLGLRPIRIGDALLYRLPREAAD